jgi:hypothetical protein
VSLAYLAFTWVMRLVDEQAYPPLSDRPLLIYSAATMLLGAQMLSMGILAEMLTASRRRDEDTYSIAERSNAEQLRVLRLDRPLGTAQHGAPPVSIDRAARQRGSGAS